MQNFIDVCAGKKMILASFKKMLQSNRTIYSHLDGVVYIVMLTTKESSYEAVFNNMYVSYFSLTNKAAITELIKQKINATVHNGMATIKWGDYSITTDAFSPDQIKTHKCLPYNGRLHALVANHLVLYCDSTDDAVEMIKKFDSNINDKSYQRTKKMMKNVEEEFAMYRTHIDKTETKKK